MNTRIVALFLILTCQCAVHAQQRPALDVSITSLEHTPTNTVATLHVQNNSGKDVAAFHIKVTFTRADGTFGGGFGSIMDFGYRATKDGDPKRGIPKLLAAGESYDDHVAVDSDAVNVTPTLAAIVYADRTAEGDAEAIHDVTESRQGFAKQLAKTEPEHAAAASKFAKDDLRCGNTLCSNLRRQP